jgi:uncharacterized protein
MSLPGADPGRPPAPPDGPVSHPIYRELVAAVQAGQTVTACVAGLVWTLVEAGGHSGLALTLQEGVFNSLLPGQIEGAEARSLAAHITSWNMFDASLALAALNAWYNRRARVEELLGRKLSSERGSRLFERLSVRFAGKAVAVVGHFPHLEPLRERCKLTVLERHPLGGDLPDQAGEYLLGGQDCVCITGSAVTNKTLPRLLELSGAAYVVLVGPSVPLAPLWFEHGVDLLAGTVVLDTPVAMKSVQQGGRRSLFGDSLAMVELEAEHYAKRAGLRSNS